MAMKENFKELIFSALSVAKAKSIDIYTFALYHDHESGFVSVCVDTLESSNLSAIKQNEFSIKYFNRAINEGDIKGAQRWQANGGRSLALGSFKIRNAAEIQLSNQKVKSTFYIEMVSAINEMKDLISIQSTHGKQLIFCCSTEDDEVGLVWANI